MLEQMLYLILMGLMAFKPLTIIPKDLTDTCILSIPASCLSTYWTKPSETRLTIQTHIPLSMVLETTLGATSPKYSLKTRIRNTRNRIPFVVDLLLALMIIGIATGWLLRQYDYARTNCKGAVGSCQAS